MKTSSDAYHVTSAIIFLAANDPARARPLARAFCRWHGYVLEEDDLDPKDFDDTTMVLLRQLRQLPREGDERHRAVLERAQQILRCVSAGKEVEVVDVFRLVQADSVDDEDEPAAISARP